MKKLFLIGFVIVAGLVVSCEKQDIKPIQCNHDETPTWEDRKSVSTVSSTDGNEGDGNGGGITDPNNDEDGNGRKKV